MMKLSLMHKVVATIDKDYRSPILSAVGAPWGCDPDKVYFWRASANFACITAVGDQRVFLRFNSITERTPQLVEAEVEVLSTLAKLGLSVNAPVKSVSGRYVEVVATEWGAYVAVAFTRLTGKHIDSSDMAPEQLRAWGAELAKLHNVSGKLPSVFVEQRPSWVDLLDFAAPFALEEEIKAELQAVREDLANLPQNTQNYGLIHFDFESDNLVWEDGRISVLDFDDSARMWYAADIVFAVRDFFKGQTIDVRDSRFQLFIEGYRSERTLDDSELMRMPLYVRFHRLFFIARLRLCLDIDINNRDLPDWLINLYRKLSCRVEQYIADIRAGQIICN